MDEPRQPADTGNLRTQIKRRILELLDIRKDKENDIATIELLKQDVDFGGTKLWILVCAIFIASLGLNVNSSAVIIGAMLISPLMGPIIGFGLGLGISDFRLIKRALRNLGLMTLFSLATATIYFLISPLSRVQSELAARTTPTIYDVLIAFFGGAAGIIAGSTKNKGNVIPGVAIATALMPPLCTAGFGLATGNLNFFLGAFYLYVINSVFIALATFIMVRLLKFPRKVFMDKTREMRVNRFIGLIVLCTIVPSIYLGYGMVRSIYADESAARFVREQLAFSDTQVLSSKLKSVDGQRNLEVVILGNRLSPSKIDSVATLLPSYGLGDTKLVIRQGFEQETDIQALKHVVLQDFYANSEQIIFRLQGRIDSLQNLLGSYDTYAGLQDRVEKEAKLLFPQVTRLQLLPSPALIRGTDSILPVLVEIKGPRPLSAEQRKHFAKWMSARTGAKGVRLISER